ncbi:glycosyltransferase family 4 protein [Pedobacter alpinus]|uniref:Glycosyltransferase family 4 protein n=1 Tax=Pedobacter alpinus TaxID=1590643 RepID=A0ABW5TRF3_9SPHI
MKIAFIVEFPTQFEVPFYQYVAKELKAESLKLKAEGERRKAEGLKPKALENERFDFHVIFNNTDQQDYHDFELGKKVGWGFNLYEGYTHFIADRNDIVNAVDTIITRENYDYIILNGYKNSYKGLAKLCKSKNIPIALRIDSVLYNLSPVKKFLKRIYLPFAYRQFDHFFAVGSETKRFLNWLSIANHRISYFSYSVDEVWFKAQSADVEKVKFLKETLQIKNETVLLSVAKFVPRESPWDILEAFKLLNDKNLTLILVGDGEERKALEEYANQNSHLQIIFTGYVPYQQLPYYYGLSTIFIHAAKNEPWGVSVHEALSCNCSVITSDKVGSSKDLIVEGKNGHTYPFGDYKYLADKIQESIILNGSIKNEINQIVLEKWGYQFMWKEIKTATLRQNHK